MKSTDKVPLSCGATKESVGYHGQRRKKWVLKDLGAQKTLRADIVARKFFY